MTALHAGPVRPSDAVPDEIVRAAQRGDEAAFAALYDAYAPRLYALCVGLAGDREAAAELVQDVFVRVWEKLGSFRGDSAFSSWLHRLAVNVALESKRTGQRRSLRVMIAADLQSSDSAGPMLLEGPANAVDTGLAMDLEGAIARLPAGARAVFVLHDVEGYRHDEIGERLGIAEGTSRAHLFRARRLLREALDR
jgi:RNA polymerase sigma-70 factor (ECF subfamily)